MQFTKMQLQLVPAACAVVMLASAAVLSQPAKKAKTDTATVATPAKKAKTDTATAVAQTKKLKPQTTCPVMGNPIDKKLFVDYNGKRIYVCCSGCIAEVTKDPEKYIKKLDSLGQSVETIAAKTTPTGKKASAEVPKEPKKDAPVDTSKKSMDIKEKKKPAATTTPTAEAGYWTCSMHPEVHQAEAGTCPKCGMKLVFKKNETDTTKMKGMDKGKKKM